MTNPLFTRPCFPQLFNLIQFSLSFNESLSVHRILMLNPLQSIWPVFTPKFLGITFFHWLPEAFPELWYAV